MSFSIFYSTFNYLAPKLFYFPAANATFYLTIPSTKYYLYCERTSIFYYLLR